MPDPYDADVLDWSEHQARLLRSLASGSPANEAPDWLNIAEEIESVGRSQLSAVRSLLMQALAHDLKCEAWPSSGEIPNWRADARLFRIQAADAYTPSMRQRLDLADIYRKAIHILPDTIDGQPPQPLPQSCPATLDEMLAQD